MKNGIGLIAVVVCATVSAMSGCGNEGLGTAAAPGDAPGVEATSEALTGGVACYPDPGGVSASPNYIQSPNNAIDRDLTTRWESAHADNQFIEVDLGQSEALTGVTLTWETACGKDYNIDTADAANGPWTTMAQVRGNTASGTAHPLTHNFTKTARFVRMNGLTRCTQYGFSLWELRINSSTVVCTYDHDGDGFGAQEAWCGFCAPGQVKSTNDCNDRDANARPNQTNYFFTPDSGRRSWDYNCDNTIEAQGTDGSYYFCATAAGVKVNDCSQCAYNWLPSDATDCGQIRCSLDGGNVHVGCH
jgi:hypothetical protein